jgi:hypothetical protein
VRGQINRAIAF